MKPISQTISGICKRGIFADHQVCLYNANDMEIGRQSTQRTTSDSQSANATLFVISRIFYAFTTTLSEKLTDALDGTRYKNVLSRVHLYAAPKEGRIVV